MNGKKYSTSQKRQTGRFRASLTLFTILIITGLLSVAILSAAALYQPEMIEVRNEFTYTAPTTPSDLEYIRTVARQEATLTYYSSLVGCNDTVSLVLAAAREYDVSDVEVLFALMWKESMFLPTAVNRNARSTDRGLFQLNSAVYSEYPAEQFFNIEWNIRTGVRHYATELAVADGNHQVALHAYNAGRSRRYAPPPSTEAYAIEVLQIAQRYKDEKNTYIRTVLEDRLAMYK